ncbi:MAG: hypothetical protein HYZ40_14390 [Rhodospirillales bacterium]|nr:hypothetical protein [Rhodospirillales bacterium]
MKFLPMITLAACTFAACTFAVGCASYSERVVEKPVPARPVTTTERTIYTDYTGQPASTTTVYTTR